MQKLFKQYPQYFGNLFTVFSWWEKLLDAWNGDVVTIVDFEMLNPFGKVFL
jgi:hypothetical protein